MEEIITMQEIEYILGPYKTMFCPKIHVLNKEIISYMAISRYSKGYYITSIGLKEIMQRAKELSIFIGIDFNLKSLDFYKYK